MPAGHRRGDDKSINIGGFQTQDIISAGSGCLLKHIKETRLPYSEFTGTPTDDYGFLLFCHA
jgi:hypothetical protein